MALTTASLSSRNSLLIIGVVFHLVYIFSIFDIYFKSPLIHGMTPYHVELPAPADRLFLFVGDGLRADKLFQLYEEGDQLVTKAPFLRDVIFNQGTWGVSHTRVPTESRPGHVAIIAGFYEDVSAVTTGWTMNPVNFDSVFNQSEHTWSFGSPDILPMFQHGASDPSRVETFMYGAHAEDFSSDATFLDTFVFDHVTDLFRNATTDPILAARLRRPKIIFFLHLLGLDINGHAHRPHSPEYINNIAHVDKGIQKVVELVEKFYENDGRTSYVFTADHGMNNRGAHGDGHPDNTRTPLIAWGAGVRKPNRTHPTGHDDFSRDWVLNELQRNDVKQADIAPLMASLVGLNYPVNSVGELPLVYLENTPLFKAQATFVNAKEILAQYQVKYDMKQSTELFFKPFAPLSNATHTPTILVSRIQSLIDEARYDEAELLCLTLIDLSLRGLRYFQTYDWLFLRGIVSAGYLGWMLYSLNYVIATYVVGDELASVAAKGGINRLVVNLLATSSLLILYTMLYVQEMPPMYYAYTVFPVYFWSEVLKRGWALLLMLNEGFFGGNLIGFFGLVGGVVVGLEVLVFSFFHREVLSGCFVLAAAWPLFISSRVRSRNGALLLLWVVSCLGTSVFTLLPVEKGEDIPLVLAGGALILTTGAWALWKTQGFKLYQSAKGQEVANVKATNAQYVISFQLVLIAASVALVYDTTQSLKQKTGLPVVNQILSWIVLGVSSAIPFLYGLRSNHHFLQRLTVICLAFSPTIILLSISYETLFYYFFCVTVLLWMLIERRLYAAEDLQPGNNAVRTLKARDARTALTFLFFINVAFFGTGNVASLSSFSLESVYRLTTVFNPFLWGALLIAKILIPFFVVSAVLGVLARSLDLPAFSLFLIVLSVTDVQTLNFFFLVRDDGSWLEIGTSISHFCISEMFLIFTILLFWLSHLLVGRAVVTREGQKTVSTGVNDNTLIRKDKIA